jgi:hypothetical protein
MDRGVRRGLGRIRCQGSASQLKVTKLLQCRLYRQGRDNKEAVKVLKILRDSLKVSVFN